MKKNILLFVVLLLFTGCTQINPAENPANYERDECELFGTSKVRRSARINDTILYDCGQYKGIYIQTEKTETLEELEEITQNFDVYKISSSDQYFYISGMETSDTWGGKSNVLIVDKNGEIIAARECSCEWIYVVGNTVLGYYNGHDDFDEDVGWKTERIEVTHYIDENSFIENEKDDISNWTSITGNEMTINGEALFQQKDTEHVVTYYTDMVYYDAYDSLKHISYVDGCFSSTGVEKKAKKYVKQLYDIMGTKEKNFTVFSWQLEDQLYGVCNVYDRSGGISSTFYKGSKK